MNRTHTPDLFVAAPHAHGGESVARSMRDVHLALLPATLFSFWLFGWQAVLVWTFCVAGCLLAEALCLHLMRQPVRTTLADGSAALTGALLALSLPPGSPWWVPLLGAFIAIIVGKQVFGGLGQNVFNPAMVARVALLVSFPLPLTQWVSPLPLTGHAPGLIDSIALFFSGASVPDSMASASILGYSKTELARGIDLLHSLAASKAPASSWIGVRPGSLGESATLLLLLGGAYLLWRRVISWHIPVAVLAGLAIPATIAHTLDPAHHLPPVQHLLSGAAVLGAVFIATDYVTSPNTRAGQLLYAFGIGLITWIIRTWGGYPEGMAFAVLLMNALTPVIDRLVKPRVFGHDRHGKAMAIETAGGK